LANHAAPMPRACSRASHMGRRLAPRAAPRLRRSRRCRPPVASTKLRGSASKRRSAATLETAEIFFGRGVAKISPSAMAGLGFDEPIELEELDAETGRELGADRRLCRRRGTPSRAIRRGARPFASASATSREAVVPRRPRPSAARRTIETLPRPRLDFRHEARREARPASAEPCSPRALAAREARGSRRPRRWRELVHDSALYCCLIIIVKQNKS